MILIKQVLDELYSEAMRKVNNKTLTKRERERTRESYDHLKSNLLTYPILKIIRLNWNISDNKDFAIKLNRDFIRWLKRSRPDFVGYQQAIEHSEAKNYHFHYILYFKPKPEKDNTPTALAKEIVDLWNKYIEKHVNKELCKPIHASSHNAESARWKDKDSVQGYPNIYLSIAKILKNEAAYNQFMDSLADLIVHFNYLNKEDQKATKKKINRSYLPKGR